MKAKYLLLATVTLCIAGLPAYGQRAVLPNKAPITVNDVFSDFPALELGMTYDAAKALLVKRGLMNAGFKGTPSELAWDSKFGDVQGRATMFFKPGAGAWEIAVVLYAMDKQSAVAKRIINQVEARNGPAGEVVDDEDATSHVWRFDKGLALEIRWPKDRDQLIVDIHWIKL